MRYYGQRREGKKTGKWKFIPRIYGGNEREKLSKECLIMQNKEDNNE